MPVVDEAWTPTPGQRCRVLSSIWQIADRDEVAVVISVVEKKHSLSVKYYIEGREHIRPHYMRLKWWRSRIAPIVDAKTGITSMRTKQ